MEGMADQCGLGGRSGVEGWREAWVGGTVCHFRGGLLGVGFWDGGWGGSCGVQ